MFGKKICRQCGMSTKNKYDFCPHCGNRLENKNEDFGMLGKDDFFNDNNINQVRMPTMSEIFNLIKDLSKQSKKIQGQQKDFLPPNLTENPGEKKHFSINISIGKPIPMNPGSVGTPVQHAQVPKEKKKKSFEDLSPEKLKKFSKLPKEEPKTNIRRLSNKVFYEVDLPGVKSAKDISLLNLEKGVELKAISDKKAYMKSIPINLPILKYRLSKGKLVLEMDAHEN